MQRQVNEVQYDDTVNRPFQDDLRERVRSYVDEHGRFATPFAVFKIVFFLVMHWSLWVSLAFFDHSVPVALLLIMAYALACIGVTYNISHDAVHQSIARSRWVNEVLYRLSLNPVGPSHYLWRDRHRIMHHQCVNIPGLDFNIEVDGPLRFSPTQPWRPLHRYQHLYAPVLYALFCMHWVFVKDLKMLRLKRYGNLTGIQHRWPALLEMAAWKAWYVVQMFVIPTVFTSWTWWQVLLGYVFFGSFLSFQIVLTFVGSHLNQPLVFVQPDEDGRIPHSFLEHGLRTSMDFSPEHPVVSFFLGGFNSHVAHHLFPNVCSIHYPAITRIIRDTAREHGLPYHEMGIVQLYIHHFRYLADLGKGPHEPDAAYLYPTPS